jgi:hypothetical protein
MMDYTETIISIVKRNSTNNNNNNNNNNNTTDISVKLNTGKRLRSKTTISSKSRPLISRLRINKTFTLLDIKLAVINLNIFII